MIALADRPDRSGIEQGTHSNPIPQLEAPDRDPAVEAHSSEAEGRRLRREALRLAVIMVVAMAVASVAFYVAVALRN